MFFSQPKLRPSLGSETIAPFWHAGRRRSLGGELRTRLKALLRANIRNSDIGLVMMSACLGGIVGVVVSALPQGVAALHTFLFGIPFDVHLSSGADIEPWRLVAIPSVGGLFYGIVAWALRRWRRRDIVDAIEANALYGGRMSLNDSIRLAFLTVISAGVGASVGLEAAYTQLGSGTASRIGRSLRLRRADLRTFVGAGAAAAIAAAFNAPLAGAFYAFELIVGTYTLGTLAPIGVAALAATLVERQLYGDNPIFVTYDHIALSALDYLLLVIEGVLAALLGIAAMVGVTRVESLFRRIALPSWARPAVGGTILGGMAIAYPQVLGSGHGGIVTAMSSTMELPLLLVLIVGKAFASALSVGCGFRGGMFSSSLFLGTLFGSAIAALVGQYVPWMPPNPTIFVLAGMGAVAAAVVGAPVTMILLVLEATSDFSAMVGVAAAVIVASLGVRQWFGYSFATWRFHLRGVPLRGAHDIGWLQDLTVDRVMVRDFSVVPLTMPLSELRAQFPIGGNKRVFAVDDGGHYAGAIDLQEVHATDHDPAEKLLIVKDLVHGEAHFLTPYQPVRVALDLFIASATEALAVVDNPIDRRITGYLTEAYALRRYNAELEARRREELGDDELFSPTTTEPN
ncbi:MAG TPA: chloride channel protein [Alphaproteobacteria bacterium]|nr:chloride channel protein [Alphaproteobacteria bacterium]